jgi:RluA family pseudouridine synthase
MIHNNVNQQTGRIRPMQDTPVDILYEEGPVLAINKPAGLATQAPQQFDSLERRLRQFLAERAQEATVYLGVPHRLDRAVSGVILFATKRRAAFKLSRQFERRSIEKNYWALVEGAISPDAGTWTDHMRKIYGHPRAEIVDACDEGAQLAVLHYRAMANDGKPVQATVASLSALEIRLETGRTHQIRVQASSRGHAVLGDTFYGAKQSFGFEPLDEPQRAIALHARSIRFAHPTSGEMVTIEAPLPDYWPRCS